eukprot:TRINITY_DN11635_c0_g1_i1.p1 TRINITY_DN11635_c0_g1~~TRINITY_DN11635_c0_g1_i1.p1  ORF type:complete len:260 (+),score=46.85 TRINITY_DN11635_c0_g1_i1:150-929(+)
MSLHKKVVIVTGGASGIGRASTLKFATEGADVVFGDVSEEAGSEVSAAWQQDGRGSVTFFKFDAASGEDCRKLVEFSVNKFGRVDVLFNNVGIQPKESRVPIHLLEEATWDNVMNVNLKSAFWMCKYVVPHMLKQSSGAIINNASIQGINSQKLVGVYAATKGGLLSLTRQLACEYGGNGIRCNAISPGSIVSELMRKNTNLEYVTGNTPLGCVGEPDDIADAAVFLASSKSKWVTGHNFVVDGGVTIKGGWASLQITE